MKKVQGLRGVTKIVYGTGDFYGGASATIISMLFLFFLTDVIGIRPVYAGIVVFAGRLVDAVTDPLMGRLSDHTRSRFGRRSIYFISSAVPVGLTFFLLWIKIPGEQDLLQVLYYGFAYILFSLAFTSVMVPYAALAPELTPDYHERTSLVSTRMAFSIIGALFAAVFPKMIIDSAAESSSGFITMGLIFAFVFMIIWLNMFLHMKDREIYPVVKDHEPFIKALISTIKNKAFRNLIGMYLFVFIVNDIMSANFIYFLTYYLKKPGLYTIVMGGLLITAVVSLIAYVKLSKALGKRKTFLIGVSYWLTVIIGLFILTPAMPAWSVIVYAVLLGAGLGVAYAIPWAMLPDVIDLDEIISNKRREGLYSGVMTFLRKLSSSIAILGISFILDVSGYISTEGSESITQPESAVLAIRLIITVLPILCLTVAWFNGYRFPIRPHNFSMISEYLNFKKNPCEATLPQTDMINELSEMAGQTIDAEGGEGGL